MGKKFINSILFFIICCNIFAAEYNNSNYYVKVDGTGDGSSWDKAMSAEKFAEVLSSKSEIKAGVTFHLATGTYHPMYDPFEEDHEGYVNAQKYKLYYISKPVNIIGGYSANPTKDEKPNPTTNPTIISGDILDDDYSGTSSYMNDDLLNLFCIDLKEKDVCSFYGLILTRTDDNRGRTGGAFAFGGDYGYSEIGAILKVDRCTIKDMTNAFSKSNQETDELEVTNTTFENVTNLYCSFSKANFNSCTFFQELPGSVGFSSKNMTIKNCTFYEFAFYVNLYDYFTFHNNTVVVEKAKEDNIDYISISCMSGSKLQVSLIGNIFDCKFNLVDSQSNIGLKMTSKYNLFKEVNDELYDQIYTSNGNYFSSSVNKIFETDYAGYAMLKNNYGYTQTVKLKRDKLDNTPLHFDLNETTVETDQRGVLRSANTCLGSYEKRDTTFLYGKDTIPVGKSFFGKMYNKIGIYKAYEISNNADGYDSVSVHTLYVMPNSKQTTFYVKVDGTGDGSSWEDAMSPEDFALRFQLTKTTDTFHVAEGTYYPIEINGSKMYQRSYPFVLIGGYQKDILDEQEKPNPTLYKTVLSVDFNNNDKFDETLNELINTEDDLNSIIYYYSSVKDDNVFVSGIVFEGGSRTGTIADSYIGQFRISSGDKFTFDKCEFRNGSYYAVNSIYGGNSLIFNNCYFYQVRFHTNKVVKYNSCTFERIYNQFMIPMPYEGSCSIINCTMTQCVPCQINVDVQSKLDFVNNTISMPKGGTALQIENNSQDNEINLIGNIIQGSITKSGYSLEHVKSSYNVYSEINDFKSTTDIVTDEFSSFLSTKTDESYMPPVLPLKKDSLSDGITSLRFNRQTSVKTDQKGDYRSAMTCRGSYEIVKLDTVRSNNKDSIYVGRSFEGVTYEKIGIYDSIPIVKQGVSGHDSIVELHTLYVLPKSKQTTFYVKIDGTGDGSSWEKAMSSEDFALRFQLTETTDTFHLAEGTYYPIEIQGSRIYDRTYPFTLIGGYRKDISDEQEKPNPTLYKTVLSVDFNGDNKFDETSNNLINDNEDSFYVIIYTSKSNDEVFVSGIVFEGGRRSYGGDSYIGQFTIKDGNKFTFEKCEFRNSYNMAVNSTFGGRSVIFNNCYFYQVRVDAVNVLKYNSCTFENIHNSFYFSAFKKGSTSVSNCSILNCIPCYLSLSSSEKIDFVNNTLSMPRGENAIKIRNYDEDIEVNMIGNIIQGSITKTESEKSLDMVKSSYNVYSEKSEITSETDIVTEDFSLFLASDASYEKDVFTPLLALENDKLADGTSLRFPRSESLVEVDQRGVVRSVKTNMGSYELFKIDTISLSEKDTIYVGRSFEGVTYGKIGIYDSIPVMKQDVSGRDSIVELHTLYVIPTGKQTTFYVKTNGKGNGSSWDNAMSPEDFAWQMALSQTPDTFHVAAGTYYPIGTITSTKHYDRVSPFCLIGGYPSDITDENQKPDPINNETIFSVDFEKNNTYDSDEHIVITGEDDERNIFAYSPYKEGDCLVSGIVFEGGREGNYGNMEQFRIQYVSDIVFNFTFENCTFRKGFSSVFNYSSYASVSIKDCYFYHIKSPLSFGDFEMSSCTFDDCNVGISSPANKSVNVFNCTMFNLYDFKVYVSENSQLNFYNNTVYSPSDEGTIVIDNNIAGDLNLKGNIIQGTIQYNDDKISQIHSSYNLFSQNALAFMSTTDLVTDDYTSLFDDKTEKEEGVFTPILVLKSDVSSSGSSLRFPNDSESKIEYDQRGVSRSSHTCMGSYEIPKADTIILNNMDTIKVGETFIVDDFVGEKYDKIGIYDSVAVDYPDKVVLHTVCVIPSGKQTTFYVKIKGNGDGSSWKEAMSPEQFAWQMALSENVDTFHVAEGIYHPIEIQGSKVYTRTKPFVLIGGYDEDVTDEKESPDPIHHETILSADFDKNNVYDSSTGVVKNTEDDGSIILSYSVTGNTNSLISGIVFDGGKAGPMGQTEQCAILSNSEATSDFTFEKCEFRNGYMSARNYASTVSLYFNNCYFYHTPSPASFGDLLNVTSSTFEGGKVNFYSKGTMTISNCSMFDLEIFNVSVPENSQMNYYNNTIYSPSKDVAITFKNHAGELNLIGNIIHGVIEYDKDNLSHIHSDKNIFSEQDKTDGYKTSEDFFIDDISYFLDDNLISRGEGVFTPVFVLKHDTLKNGTSIRFPLSETNLLTDQRGVNRADLTCPGVYEIACRDVTNHLTEIEYYSIDNQSEGYNFETYGLHEFVEKKKCRCGSDSIVYHNVYIVPSASKKNYYVTTKGSGTGDGSSWENAMNDTSFAYLFANAQNNVTFHVAEGTYYPVNIQGSRTYQRSYPFTLIGGYRKEILDVQEAPDPIHYKTILSVDFDGDNKFDATNLKIKNSDEDEYTIINLTYNNQKDAEVLISGIVFVGGRAANMGRVAQCQLTYGNKFTFNQCEFKNGYGSVEMLVGVENVIFNNCYFYQVGGPLTDVAHSEYNACTFNKVYDRLGFTAIDNTSVSNCTMIQCAPCGFYMMNSDATLNFVNNSVCMPLNENALKLSTYLGGNLNLMGNLIHGAIEKPDYIENVDFVTSLYNVYAKEGETKSDKDIVTDEFSSFLASDVTNEENVFTPILALKNDKLSGGEVLRFPRAENVILDQRGIERPSMTNMGSYELVKNDTVFLEKMDTIKLGESFEGVTYEKLGIYDSIMIVKPITEERDSVIFHTVCVIPTGEQTTFYVKTDGDGDGSSWEEAMSPEQFAWQMALSQTIDTFHVAEGTYYPIDTKQTNGRTYNRTLPFTLKGGYRDEITEEEEEADPVQHKTILSIDFNNDNSYEDGAISNIDDDGFRILKYNSSKAGKSLISGIVFDGGTCDRNCINAQCEISNLESGINEITFDQCEFRNSRTRGILCSFDKDTNDVLNINRCYFNHVGEYHLYYPAQYEGTGMVNFNACTFTEFKFMQIYSSIGQTVTYSNCTLYDCANINLETGNDSTSILNFINNTVYTSTKLEESNKFKIESPANIHLTGNIIQADVTTETSDLSGIRSKYNVYNKQSSLRYETDITTDDFSFLDDTISSDKSLIAPIIALKSDSIDGASLRFPRLENVETDQRGAIRAYETCRGSYELVKNDTVFLDVMDTIRLGESFAGKTYDKLGVYDSIDVVLHTVGRDSVVVHTVCVIPTGEQTTFYVKTDGDGDGSSWEEAMSPEQFAWQMALSQNIDTFHVAEGTYYPIETKRANERAYNRTYPFTLKGGYRKEITDEAEDPDPIQYKTVLSADFNGDNKFDETSNALVNFEEDSYEIITYSPGKKSNDSVFVSGIVFDGGGKLNTMGDVYIGQFTIGSGNDKITFEKCEFRNCARDAVNSLYGGKSIIFNNCYFHHLGVGAVSVIKYNSCTFENITGYLSLSSTRVDALSISNCTMVNSAPYISLSTNSKIDFVNNTISTPRDGYAINIRTLNENAELNMIGNIVHGPIQIPDQPLDMVKSSYNVYSEKSEITSETDIVTEDFSLFLASDASLEKDVFTPLLALENDKLADGTSLRFPRLENVETDQRGAIRAYETCRGSYELVKNDTVFLDVMDT
ncbi:MAG: right-handed parallel beta-helix repeat-containing protein, partial [Paludibacteraceae bacterium]|nr:right-handed parallel beta-helix repeat-containing protein [Paludibacteraceae bacterium]